jgi:TPR repeat protein
MAEATSSVNNGVNVAPLIAAREALTNAPAAAQFKWRAACEWKNGTHSHSTVESFYGLGQVCRATRGDGVARDYVQAARWYRKGADQGYAMAQLAVGGMDARGVGVPRDYVRAYMWIDLATGEISSTELLNGLEKVMTADQIAEAQKLAREWKPGQK